MRMTPVELGNPVFDTLNETHEITLVVRFPPLEDVDGSKRMNFIEGVESWGTRVLATFGELEVESTWIRMRFILERSAKQSLEDLLWLIRACVDAQEIWIGLHEATEVGLEQVRDPRQPPVWDIEWADEEEYLSAAFRLDGPPPPSELPERLRGVVTGDEVWTEERGMTLFVPGLRLCYGLAGPRFFPHAPRCGAVAAALNDTFSELFARQFAGPEEPPVVVPDVLGQQRDCGIFVGGGLKLRVGYSFFVEARCLLTRTGKQRVRFREHELFSAVCATAARLRLLPLVTWERTAVPSAWPKFDEPRYYIFQLWEP